MQTKENILLTLLFLITFFTGETTYAMDTARQTLDKAAAKVNLAKGAYATFSITGAQKGTYAGTIAIKGNKFNAKTKNSIIWFDGKTQWLYNKKNEEVNISTPKSSQQASMNPYHFLTLYKKGYTLSLTTTAKGYNIHAYGGKSGIKEMYILIDKAYNIKQIKFKQGQQWITITVNSLTSKNYNDAVFRFNAKDFPKAELIDLR